MKTATIGDVHGSVFWREAEENVDQYDKIIFVGDYLDHWTITSGVMERNLLDIIEFKKKHPAKVELLLGNHDLQYYFMGRNLHSCSGLRGEKMIDWNQLFKENMGFFKAAHYEEVNGRKYLWTHAGVSNEWYVRRLAGWHEVGFDDIGELINYMFRKYRKGLFDVGYERWGSHPFGGIFWADKRETQPDMLDNVNQIVGHTKVDKIEHYRKDENTSITYVDVFESDNPEIYKLEL